MILDRNTENYVSSLELYVENLQKRIRDLETDNDNLSRDYDVVKASLDELEKKLPALTVDFFEALMGSESTVLLLLLLPLLGL